MRMSPKNNNHRAMNTFFDINKLPKEEGLLLFPISMSRIANSQDPAACLKYIKKFTRKISEPRVGLNFIYGDTLYLLSSEKASVLKEKFMFETVRHKNAMQKLLLKNYQEFQIQHAFNFMTWGQLYLGTNDFPELLTRLRKLYKQDKKFQKYVKEDAVFYKKKLTAYQIDFFLEEHLMFYLASKGKIKLPNDYIQGKEKWVLWCYPGMTAKASIYLYQLNPFHLKNPSNKYEKIVLYNLEKEELYDSDFIDLETYTLS